MTEKLKTTCTTSNLLEVHKEVEKPPETPPISPFQSLIDRLSVNGSMNPDAVGTCIDWLTKNLNERFENKIPTVEELREYLPKLTEMNLQFQPYIEPPVTPDTMIQRATSNDRITITSWKKQWFDQLAQNKARYDWNKDNVMNVHGVQAMKPVICIGSGPSLRKTVGELAKNGQDICKVACCHSFAYLEDHGAPADYYVNLDAGDVTIEELSQGGKEDPEYYWKLTKDRVLVTASVGNPKFLKKWKGKILFYSIGIPDQYFTDNFAFEPYFTVGGNTLGAGTYFAKAILGANPVIFMGADFSFGSDKRFHSWDSPYDQKYQGLIPWTNIFGNRVMTWPSYFNFKSWFDFIACGGPGGRPGLWINATEGGILGAYPEGNIRYIYQMSAREALMMYNDYKIIKELIKPESLAKTIY